MFNDELLFERALVDLLKTKGWEQEVIQYPTEDDLIKNWASILYENNKGVDQLNGVPLTESEMQQLLEEINRLHTPLKLNSFINGKTVSIKRDNPEDTLHYDKEVSLKIYDRMEIAGGKSRYQIVEQPCFRSRINIFPNRRGDIMLLINGMPLFHIELKKSNIPISQATHQIEIYSHENVFTGLFSLVQIFVAMTPEETVYFANPGTDGVFNKDYYFHWEDFNNEPVNDWKQIADKLLSIPMAHQMIGFYTVPDSSDGILKVMRSYQVIATQQISDAVTNSQWDKRSSLGGFVWHTTGSGKTMTSFKAAKLIADSKDADKVVFLMDRIELGTQSLGEYRGFADDPDSVQETEDTGVLITKLKSNKSNEKLIVTSIQKMSNIKADSMRASDLAAIKAKKLVFVVDECHRSTFGEMMITIKDTFPTAMYFGFTGTPIFEDNRKNSNETSDVFGNELHHYTIADGIRDKNVLGFDPKKILTYADRDLRTKIALEKAKASSITDALQDPAKQRIFYHWMNDVTMIDIEAQVPTVQYNRDEHRQKVVEDILNNWEMLSVGSKFHAILATSSIPEAIEYYRIIKDKDPNLKITAMFDPSEGNNDFSIAKEEAIAEIITDYNERYGQNFNISSYARFKKDVAYRLAHKDMYKQIDRSPEKQLDLVIVVDQLLTGFDSKWVNTLYIDKKMQYEGIIQSFSRTNRLFGPEKQFGNIRYYRYPHTMEKNIEDAFRIYSWERPAAVFVEKLEGNIRLINVYFAEIQEIFRSAGVQNFSQLPDDSESKAKFASTFIKLRNTIAAARVQGFRWDRSMYNFEDNDNQEEELRADAVLSEGIMTPDITEIDFNVLVNRYKELVEHPGTTETVPYEIDATIIEIDTAKIDNDYMNSKFRKYLKQLSIGDVEATQAALDELYSSFASLHQDEQKYANVLIHDIQNGDIVIEEGKSIREYITEYQITAKNGQIHRLSEVFGLDEQLLNNMMNSLVTESNINEYGRLDNLKDTVDVDKAKAYFEQKEQRNIPKRMIPAKVDELLRNFIINGGFDI